MCGLVYLHHRNIARYNILMRLIHQHVGRTQWMVCVNGSFYHIFLNFQPHFAKQAWLFSHPDNRVQCRRPCPSSRKHDHGGVTRGDVAEFSIATKESGALQPLARISSSFVGMKYFSIQTHKVFSGGPGHRKLCINDCIR